MDLWKHQKEALEAAKRLPFFFFGFEMGTGKTRTMIELLVYIWGGFHEFCTGRVRRVLILAPLSVVENWRREIGQWGPKLSPYVVVLEGTREERVAAYKNAPTRAIFITNIDTINTSAWDVIGKDPYDVLIIDESHKFKNPSALRFKKLFKLARRCTLRYCLSGSPILNSEMDIWAQCRLLSENIFQDFFYFRLKYFTNKNQNHAWKKYPEWTIKPGAIEQIQKILSRFYRRALKSECLDLPEIVRSTRYVQLTEEQAKAYKEIEKLCFTIINSAACAPSTALTQLLRLEEITSGILATDKGRVALPTGKYEVLAELLEEVTPSQKVIIWTPWTATYERIAQVCRELGLKHVRITGEQSKAERDKAIWEFQTKDDVRVVIANPACGGVGINLTAASVMIYFAKTYNLEHDVQSEARAHRGGSEIHKSITRIDLVTKGTIEEAVTESLRRKLTVAEFVLSLRGLKQAA